MRFNLNKKGFVWTPFVEIWWYILFVIAILIFLFVTRLDSDPLQGTLTGEPLTEFQGERVFHTLLETPFTYKDTRYRVIDFVMLAYTEKDAGRKEEYFAVLTQEVRKVFSKTSNCGIERRYDDGCVLYVSESPTDSSNTIFGGDFEITSFGNDPYTIDKLFRYRLALPEGKVLYIVFEYISIDEDVGGA
ncbi:MAG: hypothetical protein QF632_06185 [Candidatus Woesearchaeota archaeon]|jgi:hypothetical protein|nr:hypothetical protein [Candidatus Woesearchaeota archaeon]MDP7324322.1 hypothetical protein [Candidatus Woesearchaeota archaeon]MDP7458415.1 hypothetical protein [Candidatus Woesearchaeota archaeon]